MEPKKVPFEKLRYMKRQGFKELTPYIHRNLLVRWVFWKRLRTLLKLAKPARRVLDFGAGSGILIPTLSKNFPEVYAYDINVDGIKYIKQEENLQNVEILQGNAKDGLPYKNNFFDIIFAADVLEHFKNHLTVQKELKRVLRKGGYLIVSGPTETLLYKLARKLLFGYKQEDHYTNIYAIIDTAKKLFNIEIIKTIPSPLIPGFKIFRAKNV